MKFTRSGFVNEHYEEKNLEKFLKNIPGKFLVSVVAELDWEPGSAAERMVLPDPLPEIKRILSRLTRNP
jgi:hypothetical protein